MLFLLSRDHGRPAQALRKSAIKSERPRWNVRDDPCPPSKIHATKAKILGITDKPQEERIDFNQANSMADIGRKLLQSVGFASSDDVSVQEAIELNNVFVAQLEAIRGRAQRLTIE